MSGETSEDKTEKPSRRQLEKAREEGNVAKSTDATKALVLLACGLYLMFQFARLFDEIAALATLVFGAAARHPRAPLMAHVVAAAQVLMHVTLPLLLIALAGSLAGPLMQIGPLAAWKALKIDFKRVHPVEGFKKLFSAKTLGTLLLTIAKAILLLVALYLVIERHVPLLVALPQGDVGRALGVGLSALTSLFLWGLLVSVCIAVPDYAIQRRLWYKGLYMTKSQLKREREEDDGKPEVKKEIKRLQGEDDNIGRMFKNLRLCGVLVADAQGRVIGLYFNASFKPEPLMLVVAAGGMAQRVLDAAAGSKLRVVNDEGFMASVFPGAAADDPVPEAHREAALELIRGR